VKLPRKKAMEEENKKRMGGYAPSDACSITTTPMEDPLKLRFYV
jgi:hypothetical protein